MLFKKQVFLSSYEHPSSSLECFSKFSGLKLKLKLNKVRTEFFCLGVQNLSESFLHGFKLSIPILGMHFDYDELSRKKANFEAIRTSIKTTLTRYVERERAHSYWENTNCQLICYSEIYV